MATIKSIEFAYSKVHVCLFFEFPDEMLTFFFMSELQSASICFYSVLNSAEAQFSTESKLCSRGVEIIKHSNGNQFTL